MTTLSNLLVLLMTTIFASHAKIVYTTDLEGHLGRWRELVATSEGFTRGEDGRTQIADGWTFVFGGDVSDRYPHELALLEDLVPLLECSPERAVSLLGNRDVNKMHLASVWSVNRFTARTLKMVLEHANAARLFDGHRAQLEARGLGTSDVAVADSLVGLVRPGGLMRGFIERSRLAHVDEQTLFVHAAWTGQPRDVSAREHVTRLNAYKEVEVASWASTFGLGGQGIRGLGLLNASYSDDTWNPRWPSEDEIESLKASRIHRLVVGHRAYGETPAVLRRDDFEIIFGDTSACADCGVAIVEIDQDRTRLRARLAGGQQVDTTFTRGDGTPYGRWTEDGWLVVGRTTADEWVLFRNPGNSTRLVPGPNLQVHADRISVTRVAQPIVAFESTLTLVEDRARTAALGAWDGADLSADQVAELVRRAPTITNSFEIGQYIRLAAGSRDSAWVPVLDAWIKAWARPEHRWQRYLHASAVDARQKLGCGDLLAST